MEQSISHDRNEETPEAKARWFRGLSLEQRMDLLCEFTELALSIDPEIADGKPVYSTTGRVNIITLPGSSADIPVIVRR